MVRDEVDGQVLFVSKHLGSLAAIEKVQSWESPAGAFSPVLGDARRIVDVPDVYAGQADLAAY